MEPIDTCTSAVAISGQLEKIPGYQKIILVAQWATSKFRNLLDTVYLHDSKSG